MKTDRIPGFSNARGFSGLPVLGAVALLGAMLGAGFLLVSDSSQVRVERALANDVRALNAALAVHRIFNGSIEGAATPDQALAELQALNLNAPCVDRRLRAELQDSEDAASGAPRAVWNGITNRFEIVHGMIRGVKRFYMDTDLDPDRLVEEHRIAKLDFDAQESWIWEHEEEVEPVVKSISRHGSKIAPSARR